MLLKSSMISIKSFMDFQHLYLMEEHKAKNLLCILKELLILKKMYKFKDLRAICHIFFMHFKHVKTLRCHFTIILNKYVMIIVQTVNIQLLHQINIANSAIILVTNVLEGILPQIV